MNENIFNDQETAPVSEVLFTSTTEEVVPVVEPVLVEPVVSEPEVLTQPEPIIEPVVEPVVEEIVPEPVVEKPVAKSKKVESDEQVALYSSANLFKFKLGELKVGYNIVSKEAANIWLKSKKVRIATPTEVAEYYNK